MKHLLLLLVLSGLVFSSCSLKDEDTTNRKVIPSQSGAISHIQQNNTYKQALEKTSNTIKNSDEFMRCMDQSVNMCIQTAGNQIAQTTRNTDACKDLPTQDQQDGCTYAVTLIKASESKDTGLCTALMGTNRSQCETTVQKSIALAAKDIKLCDVLATTKISSGTGVALYHGPTNYDQCVMSIMMEDTSSTTVGCQKITDSSLRDMCISSVKQRPSISTKK